MDKAGSTPAAARGDKEVTIYDAWCQQWRIIAVDGNLCRLCVPAIAHWTCYLISLGGWRKRGGFCVPANLNDECEGVRQ